MKKLLRIATVIGVVCALSITALAAGSQSGAGFTGAVGPSGAPAVIEEAAPSVTPTAAQAAEAIAAEVPGIAAEDLSIPYVKDLTSNVLPVTISFEIPGATAKDTVYVLHHNGAAWEVVAKCPGNAITATFTSLSPVALALESAAAESAPEGPASPQTGEQMTILYAGAVAVLAGAAALVAYKKKETA